MNKSAIYDNRKKYKQGYIYKIVTTNNQKMYIGSTIDFKKRQVQHINDLKAHRHSNYHLQELWDSNGEEIFEFSVIETIFDTEKLADREQYWMDYYNSYDIEHGYNINKSSTSSLGRPVSEETRNKIRMAHVNSDRYGENHHSFGKKLSKETKKKISETSKKRVATEETRKKLSDSITGIFEGEKHPHAKLTEQQVIDIRLLRKFSKLSIHKIALIFNVSDSCIKNIVYNKRWTHLAIDDTMELSEYLHSYAHGED